MALPNINKLSSAELSKLITKAKALIVKKKAAERKAVKAKMKKLAAQNGMTLNEVLGIDGGSSKRAAPKAKKRAKVPPKYQNPADASQKWTGRGRQPLWVVAAIDAGSSLEDLLI